MKTALVLGGGGLVGMAYHAGALKALDEAGLDLAAADLMIGTSAGSILSSYMRCGWSPDDFYNYAHGRHPDVQKDPAAPRDQIRQIFTPMWHTNVERARRLVGSTFAMAASRGYLNRAGTPGRALRKAFPAGMYSTDETRLRFHEDLPVEWPDRDLYICAVDLYSGDLVPFGHRDAPQAPLPDAVLASTSIPGVFPPVRIGDKRYVDGGAKSATSLNLATQEECTHIICVAPLGFRSDGFTTSRDPKMWGPMFVRSLFARALKREVSEARNLGVEVVVVRPWATDLKMHGTNSMRHFDRAALSDQAREGTKRLLDEMSDRPALAEWPRKRATRVRAAR